MPIPLPPEIIDPILDELRATSFQDLLNMSLVDREMALKARNHIFGRVTLRFSTRPSQTHADERNTRSQGFLDFAAEDRGCVWAPIISVIKEVHVVGKMYRFFDKANQLQYRGPNLEESAFQQLARMRKNGLELRALRWTTDDPLDPDILQFLELKFSDIELSVHLSGWEGISPIPRTSYIVSVDLVLPPYIDAGPLHINADGAEDGDLDDLFGRDVPLSFTPIFKSCPNLRQLHIRQYVGQGCVISGWNPIQLTNIPPAGDCITCPPLENLHLRGTDCSAFDTLDLRRVQSLSLCNCSNIQPILQQFRSGAHDPATPMLKTLAIQECYAGTENGSDSHIELVNEILLHSSTDVRCGGLEELDLMGRVYAPNFGELVGERHGRTLKRLRLFSPLMESMSPIRQLELLGKNCHAVEYLCVSAYLGPYSSEMSMIKDMLETPLSLFPSLKSLTLATYRRRDEVKFRTGARIDPLYGDIDEHFFDGVFTAMASLKRVRLELGAAISAFSAEQYMEGSLDWKNKCDTAFTFTRNREIHEGKEPWSWTIAMNVENHRTFLPPGPVTLDNLLHTFFGRQ